MKSRKPFFRSMLLALTGALSETGVAADLPPAGQILYPAGSQQSFKGPEAYFTGEVQVDHVRLYGGGQRHGFPISRSNT